MALIDEAFIGELQDFDPERLAAHRDVVFGMWADYRLAYANDAWTEFARLNGGEPAISERWGIGRSVMDAIPDSLMPFYSAGYESCLRTGTPWQHEYECSSPDTFREFHQIVYLLDNGVGFLVINSLIAEMSHPGPGIAHADPAVYRDEHRFLCQCSHCRRFRHGADEEQWDWVPDWVRMSQPDTSHSICPTCYSHFYVRRFRQLDSA